MTERIAFSGVTLVDGTGADPVENAVVVVEGSAIVEVGPQAGTTLVSRTRVVDASGATLTPGLIDCHCHLGGASFPDEDGWVLEPDIDQSINSVAQAAAMLRHGVTSVRDISVHGTHLKKAIRAGVIDGPRIVPCWRGLSRRGGHGDAAGVPSEMVRQSHPWGIVADGPEEVRKITREIVKRGSECIKVWASGGGLHENESEDAQHYSYEELCIMVEEADYVHLPVAAHCECASAARDAVRAGVWSIEHGEELDEETIEIIAAKGISLVPTLVLLRQWFELSGKFGGYYGKPYIPGGGEIPSEPEAMKRLHHERLSGNLMAAKEAGIRIGLGSDSFCESVTPFGQQSLDELKALVAAGMTPMEALVAATRSGAEILRIDEITGTVERGKAADLLLFRKNPLEDVSRVDEANMLAVMKEGVFVKNALA